MAMLNVFPKRRGVLRAHFRVSGVRRGARGARDAARARLIMTSPGQVFHLFLRMMAGRCVSQSAR